MYLYSSERTWEPVSIEWVSCSDIYTERVRLDTSDEVQMRLAHLHQLVLRGGTHAEGFDVRLRVVLPNGRAVKFLVQVRKPAWSIDLWAHLNRITDDMSSDY